MFLLAALFAAASLGVWMVALTGRLHPGGPTGIMAWHAHEMVFGFTLAVIAGFLLTAVENWTGGVTAQGKWLGALALLWSAGRVLMWRPDLLPPGWADAIELSFLPAVALAIGRPILVARNRRNYVFPVLLLLLFAVDLLGHLGRHGTGEWIRRSTWIGVDVAIVMILVVTARVIPMFTANATGQKGLHRHPGLDLAAIAGMLVILGLDAAGREGWPLAVAAGATAIFAVTRTVSWGTGSSLRHPLLWILHLGHLWVPIGLIALAAAALGGIPRILALHSLTIGAIGSVTLGMMTRVTLGHTGRPLRIGLPMVFAFVAVLLAAAVRVALPLVDMAHYRVSLFVAGTLFSVAFATYLVVHLPILLSPRSDGRPG